MRDFGKWPRLLVVGEPVTPEQANEIIILTNQWWYQSTNDKTWDRIVAQACNFPMETWSGTSSIEERMAQVNAVQKWIDDHGILPLEYLVNDRLGSSWLGGVRGWCDWDGTVGTVNYNVGKWPGEDDITTEWKLIAAAFPYLDLRAQLVGEEGADHTPAMEWRIKDGRVRRNFSPMKFLATPEGPDLEAFVRAIADDGVTFNGRERAHVHSTRIRAAYEQVRDKLSTVK